MATLTVPPKKSPRSTFGPSSRRPVVGLPVDLQKLRADLPGYDIFGGADPTPWGYATTLEGAKRVAARVGRLASWEIKAIRETEKSWRVLYERDSHKI